MKKADKIREFLLFAKIPDKEVARITGLNRMTIGNIKLGLNTVLKDGTYDKIYTGLWDYLDRVNTMFERIGEKE